MNHADHPAFVATVYGPRYAPFLGPLLESIRATLGPAPAASRGLVLHQDLPERELALLARTYPEFEFTAHDFPGGGDVMHAIPRKIHAWIEGARRLADRPVVFVDCDTVLLRPLHDLIDGSADILFTWKDEVFPINTGVMAARRGDIAAHLFAAMLPRIEGMIQSKSDFAQAVGASGALDQHALRELIGFCNYDGTFTRPITAAGQTREITFRGVPCRVLNETNCRPVDADLRIIHYKTGWHPILLEGAAFTKNRPESACAHMFGLWHDLESQSSDRIARDLAFAGARAARDRFVDICGAYEERGILHSEMLAVCGVCQALGVTAVVESGRCRGQSTLVLARFFEGSSTTVTSIELARDEDAHFAEQRLAPYAHVKLLYGDAFRVLPTVLDNLKDQHVALLLDGPKGKPAIDLARDAFARHPHLVAAFIHDMRVDTPQRAALTTEPLRAFCTDDAAYIREFSALDEPCLPRPGAPITMHTWRPFMKGEDPIPAYGPTLAVVLPRPARQAAPPPAPAASVPAAPAITPDPIPNRMLRAADWRDPRYAYLREVFNTIYRDELKGAPHPSHARHPERIVTHWSREWEYPYAVINSEARPGMRIVDLGCGGSPLIPYFARRAGCRCAGVDINLTSKEGHNLRGFARPPEELFPEVTWVLRSMADTGLPGASWDRVLCISVLEHVSEDLARDTFREIRRLLAPGGRSIITTDVDGQHRTLTIDFRRLIQLAAEAGLRLRGPADFSVPPSDDRPGTYDVVGMVFEAM